jgi:hypothetical protein
MTKRCTNLVKDWSAIAQGAQPSHSRRTTLAQRLTEEEPMNLVPIRPPGPALGKARAFSGDIVRLRSQGYTFEAIREALAAAGVHVRNSTVQREVARAARWPTVPASSGALPGFRDAAPGVLVGPANAQAKVHAAPRPGVTPSPRGTSSPSVFANGPSGEEVAKAFMATQITNPFLRDKEQP